MPAVPLQPPDFEQWYTARAGTGAGFPTLRQEEAELALPSGRVVLGCCARAGDAFPGPVPPGRYPVRLLIAEYRDPPEEAGVVWDETVAAARLVIRDEPATSWEAGPTLGGLADGPGGGPAVAGGAAFFADATSLGVLRGADPGLDLALCLDLGQDRWASPTAVALPSGEPALVAFPTGDGCYPVWAGRTADGGLGCLVMDFLVLGAAQPDPGAAGRVMVPAARLPGYG
jgi:Protein of unknown function (DUF4241)